jgi:ABC-2 type transport system permease protein
MGIDNAHYYGWQGELQSPRWATLAIVRISLLQVLRRKLYWIVISLGMVQFLLFWVIIYVVTQFKLPGDLQREMHGITGFSPKPDFGEENGYVTFMQNQSVVVMILLAFAGSLLVGSDFRLRALPFYLSRRIDRRHYIIGKLLSISALISLLTVVPAIALFVEYGMFTSSTGYWRENWTMLLSVLAYGAVMCASMSIMIVTLSAYLQRVAPIAITWCSGFAMLNRLSGYLKDATDNDYWQLIDPGRDIRLVGKLCFGAFQNSKDQWVAELAAIILVCFCGLCLVALVHRVRAVDIVE